MSDLSRDTLELLSQQDSIQSRCLHPTGTFTRFEKEEIEQSIPDRFEQQVRKHPHRLAVKTSSCELTYSELSKASNQLARAILAQQGAGGQPVALLLGHSAHALAGIMSVLKAGKIYVSLDSNYPVARSKYMLGDSQAGLMVTNDQNLSLARELTGNALPLINVDEIDPGISADNLGLSISPDSIACLVYTSGSTGQPKGVVHNHRNLLHHIRRYINGIHVCPDDRIASVRSLSFSGTLKDIYGSLLSGAAILLFDVKKEGLANLANWLIQAEATLYTSVATTFRQIVSSLTDDQKFPKLRAIYIGGEAVNKNDLELYKEHFSPECVFIHGLGISETGTVARYFMDKNTQISDSNLPCGYTVEDLEVLMLDEDGKEVGYNRVGEIAVKSRYVALGYWRKPDHTQKAFLPDPAGGNERIYLTGDLGLMLPDGCLIHMGREDFQMKVRGHRIEAAEVETALLAIDTIKEAVVIAQPDQYGDQILVAYLVHVGKQTPTVTELRESLARTLPDYMIPSAFITLDALPLTPNGKLDRKALPVPDMTRPELKEAFIAPRDEMERNLASIWEEILGIQSVGVRDDFFELGGNSLLAMRMFTRIQKMLGKNLPASMLLQASNVEQLAHVLRQMDPLTSSLLVKLQAGDPDRIPVFFPHGCGCEVMVYKDLARHLGQEQPFYAIRAQGMYGEKPPYDRIEDMASRYIKEIQTIQPDGPYFIGSGGDGGWVAFEMAQQLQARGYEVPLLIIMDAFYRTQYPPPTQVNPSASGSSSPGPSSSTPAGSRKSLFHYIRRSFHHLIRGQLIRILRDNLKAIFEKYYWGFAYGSIPRRIRFIQRRIDYVKRVRRLMTRASFKYRPRVYPGRIIYFLSEKREERFSQHWREIAAGGLDFAVIPGRHSEIWKEPNVQIMAEKLRKLLDEAQMDVHQSER